MRRKTCLFLIAVIVVLVSAIAYTNSFSGFDASSIVVRVIDGDTFEATIGRIRLADVSAPETYEEGGYEATNALSNLISDRRVYLQIGEQRSHGRLVCVVYVRLDSSYMVNVNKMLLRSPRFYLDDYPNEFNPYQWTELILYPTFVEEIKQYEIILYGTIVASVTALAILLVKREKVPVQRRTPYCHKCGTRSPEGSLYCPECGQELVLLDGQFKQRPLGVTLIAILQIGSLALFALQVLATEKYIPVLLMLFLLVVLVRCTLAYGFWQGHAWAWNWGMFGAVLGILFGLVGLPEGIVDILLNGFMAFYLTRPHVKRYFGKKPIPVTV